VTHLSLKKIAHDLKIPYEGPECICTSVSIDSRNISPGALFIAIQGPNFDGHQFIPNAISKGAVAIIANKLVDTVIPTLIVADTRIVLGQFAAEYRRQHTLPVFALTGSCGKTTTKTLLATILENIGPTLATIGTLNNDFGVPLTLLRLSDTDQFAVIEIGANHSGEIAYCANIAQPTHALITNVAAVHLEGFGSLDGVAAAKGEIYTALPSSGTALIPIDDTYANFWKKIIDTRHIITFGTHPSADIFANNIVIDPSGTSRCTLHTPSGVIDITMPLIGKHNMSNAIAAAAGAYSLGISLENIQVGLAQAQAIDRRMQPHHSKQGAVIMDDSYNANPTAFLAAIDWLSHQAGKKILVMGDMAEMGTYAETGHREVGKAALDAGIDMLLTIGKLSAWASEMFGKNSQHFEDRQDLIDYLNTQLDSQTIALVKGSRGMKMENIVKAVLEK